MSDYSIDIDSQHRPRGTFQREAKVAQERLVSAQTQQAAIL